MYLLCFLRMFFFLVVITGCQKEEMVGWLELEKEKRLGGYTGRREVCVFLFFILLFLLLLKVVVR